MELAADLFLLALTSVGTTFVFSVLFVVLRHGRGSPTYPPIRNRTSLALYSIGVGFVLFEITIYLLIVTLRDIGYIPPTFTSTAQIWGGVILGVSTIIALGMVIAGIFLDPHTFARRRRSSNQ